MWNGQKFCQYCDGFQFFDTSTNKSICMKTCPTGYIGAMNDRKCYLQSTAATLGCKGLKISADQKTCNYPCPIDDINVILPNTQTHCANQCTTPGCTNCPDGMLNIFGYDLSCIASQSCPQYYVQDGINCIVKCSTFDKIELSQKCSQCPEGQVYYVTEQGVSACNPPGNLTNEDKDTLIQMKRYIKKNYLNDKYQVWQFMNKISDLSKKLYQELTSSSNINNTFQTIEDLFDLMVPKWTMSYPVFFKVGSNSSIRTYIQHMDNSIKQIKPSLNMQGLLEGSVTDLLEFKNRIQPEQGYKVVVQIISSNPACKIRGCEQFPIIQPKVYTSNGSIISPGSPFTVDVNVPKASSKYICLNYNLETSEIICPYTIPVASNNGLTMTCEVNGATQLFLDSSSMFLSTSECPPPAPSPTPTPSPTPSPTPTPSPSPTPTPSSTPVEKNNGSSQIGTVEIIGIGIGALVGSTLFSVGGFMIYKKFMSTKVFHFRDSKQPFPVPNTEP